MKKNRIHIINFTPRRYVRLQPVNNIRASTTLVLASSTEVKASKV